MQQVNSVFSNNLFVMIIALILSLFYGSGALFLITFNASIFASALAEVIKIKVPHKGILFLYAFVSCNMGTMFIHMIPEVLGYFIAAISGGLLSTAFVNEKFMSHSFKKIIKESSILLGIAVVILYISALLEIFVSKQLNINNLCQQTWNMINISIIVIIIGILVFEFVRRKRKKRTIKHGKVMTEKTF
tara:strand:- start:5554 stop:6120 length:567 start_codon:yes stop_codon:yes gene_type:complete